MYGERQSAQTNREKAIPVSDIIVRTDGFDRMGQRIGIKSNRDLAERMRMNVSTVTRVLSGEAKPGRRFIAHALRLYGDGWFNALFQVVD